MPLEPGQVQPVLRRFDQGRDLRLRQLGEIDLGAWAAPERIDEAVAGDREDPGASTGARRLEPVGAMPDGRHHVLDQVLGQRGFGSEVAQVRLQARADAGEQLSEGVMAPVVRDRHDEIVDGRGRTIGCGPSLLWADARRRGRWCPQASKVHVPSPSSRFCHARRMSSRSR
jgi:hypothetical protein